MLAAVVDIRRWLRADRQTPHLIRLERDRDIGRGLRAGATANERVLAWWAQIADSEAVGAGAGTGVRLERLRRLATTALCVVGMLLGGSVAGVGFGYEGDYPVNLVALLGVLVAIPLLLLCFTLVLLPGRLPGLAAVQDVLAGMNIGRWVGAWLDRYAQMELFAAFPGGARTNAFGRWQIVVFSQWVAFGFFVGVLSTAWLLVAFTDLAFGWSTTLQIDAASAHRWFAVLAAPWSTWLATAVPDQELVEVSRFYRLEEGAIPAERAARLGEWWPFVMMTVVTYGLVPRLILLVAGIWRLGNATRSLLLDDPEITALIDRMMRPSVDYEREPAESDGLPDETLSAPSLAAVSAVTDESTSAVIWNDALTERDASTWLSDRFGVKGGNVLRLGALRDEREHRAHLERISSDVQRLVIFSKGWEPPLLEFSDFLDLVREVVGEKVSLVLVPVDVTRIKVVESERDIWARTLARRGDSALYAVAADEATAEES